MSNVSTFSSLWNLGFSVFPLQARSKKPVASWKRYQTVIAEPEECKAWDRSGQYNIGIATGLVSGCFVLDIDGEEGQKTLAEWLLRYSPLPNTPTVRTGNGIHYYFRYPRYQEVRNLAGKDVNGNPMPGVDVRGDGGYATAPDSIHPSGIKYEWLKNPWETPLAEAPLWLLDRVALDEDMSLPEYEDLYDGGDRVVATAPPSALPYVEAALMGELETLRAATKGNRNHALNKAAFSLGQLLHAGLDEHRAIGALADAARSIGLEDVEISVTLQSGWEAGKASPRQLSKKAVAVVADIRNQPLQSVASEHMNFALNVIQAFGEGNLIHAMTSLWHWDGSGVWARLDEREVKKVIHRIASAHPKLTKNVIASILDIAKTEATLNDSVFDRHDDMLINCLSGDLHLQHGAWALMPARRESYMTVQLPVSYDPTVDAPRFRQFLAEIFAGDSDRAGKSQAVLEMIGYSMLRSCAFERFVIYHDV